MVLVRLNPQLLAHLLGQLILVELGATLDQRTGIRART